VDDSSIEAREARPGEEAAERLERQAPKKCAMQLIPCAFCRSHESRDVNTNAPFDAAPYAIRTMTN
jgi:hypothetical protein